FGIGGIFVWHRRRTGHDFSQQLLQTCIERQWTDEFKWSKISSGNVHRYEILTDVFFRSPKTVQFHCIIVERALLTRRPNDFYKTLFSFYYHLLTYNLYPLKSFRSSSRSILIPHQMDL